MNPWVAKINGNTMEIQWKYKSSFKSPTSITRLVSKHDASFLQLPYKWYSFATRKYTCARSYNHSLLYTLLSKYHYLIALQTCIGSYSQNTVYMILTSKTKIHRMAKLKPWRTSTGSTSSCDLTAFTTLLHTSVYWM